MAELRGGLRTRMIRDSVYWCIRDALVELGWFNTGRAHKAIRFPMKPVDNTEEIAFNTLSLTDENLEEFDVEMGSPLIETSWTFYVDFYAETASLGVEMINDVRDIVMGRLPHLGRDHPRIPVYDWRMATPTVSFHVISEGALVDKGRGFPKPWMKNWYVCRFDIIDTYTSSTPGDDESDLILTEEGGHLLLEEDYGLLDTE